MDDDDEGRIDLTDEWALRNLTICVRRLADLPLHAQELVRSLAVPAEPQRSVTHA